jgi:hypothetical protein
MTEGKTGELPVTWTQSRGQALSRVARIRQAATPERQLPKVGTV